MNKKLFGIKVSTYLQAFVCLTVAFCFWLFAKYVEIDAANEVVTAFTHSF